MRRTYKPDPAKTRRKLEAKRRRLAELESALAAATDDRSQASYRGKITRCKRDIEILEGYLD